MAFTLGSAGGGGGPAKSFTPTVTFATPGDSSISYATRNGSYVRVGAAYLFTVVLEFTPTLGTASGNVRIGGLPGTASVASSVALAGMGAGWGSDINDAALVAGIVRSGATYFEIVATFFGSGEDALAPSDMTNGAAHTLTATGILFA